FVEDFLFFLSSLLAVHKIGQIKLAALAQEAHAVDKGRQRVGRHAVNPGASIIDGNSFFPDVTNVGAASDAVVGLKDKDFLVAQMLQFFGSTESGKSRADDDHVEVVKAFALHVAAFGLVGWVR